MLRMCCLASKAYYSYLRFDRPTPTNLDPNFCLCFDGIGARHAVGVTPAGLHIGL